MTKDINIPKISLKAARVNVELNQQEAAELLGIDVSTLIRWEKDPRIVKSGYHEIISQVYHYPTDYIFLVTIQVKLVKTNQGESFLNVIKIRKDN